MTEASEFRQYAEEAVRWALESTTEKERQSFFDLARAWTDAARASELLIAAADRNGSIEDATEAVERAGFLQFMWMPGI